jgi:catechol 2,3-dioxygenase-like lactoylglutathione lyase family enzyme
VTCSCCGRDYDDRMVARLDGREDVAVCRGCLEQLLGRVGVSSTPALPVQDLRKAVAFYEAAGFGVRIYEGDGAREPGFAFVDFDGQSVFDLDLASHIDPARNGGGCYIVTNDVDAWHARMSAAGLPVTLVQEQPWGMREFTLADPSGNHLRIGRGTG